MAQKPIRTKCPRKNAAHDRQSYTEPYFGTIFIQPLYNDVLLREHSEPLVLMRRCDRRLRQRRMETSES
jgi:hypothetical protein